jgi:peptide/nickel transport system substrate-binding protein
VEIVDPLTLRIRTDGPYPLLPVDMAQFAILDRETHEGATTEQFNGGSMAIGTGPFRLQRHAMGDRLELVRNDNYWGQKAAWERVTYRAIVNEAARTAALLAGDVDAIDQVPTSDAARLRRDARIQISEIQSNRVIYLAMDHGRAEASPFITDNDGRPLARNPLRDLRVRQALSIAIDRAAIVERVMEGAATPTGQFLPEGAFGNDPSIPVPQADPARARALLAEAGYPQGFRIILHGPNNRYVNDAQTIQAIAQMWTRIGVRTAVEAQPWATFVARAARGEFSAFLVGWGSGTGEASSPLRSLVATVDASRGLGASNRGRYSNPQMDAVLLRGLSELDDPRREALFQEATRIAMADVGIIPLHIQKNLWAMRRTVRHVPRTDELTRAQDFAPAR